MASEEVVRDSEHRALANQQAVLKIDREPWVFLLTLGTKPKSDARERQEP